MSTTTRQIMALILLAYLGIAGLYAIYTPDWQVPDEPAHYNYIRHLVETGRLPILQIGDYDQDYLEEIKSRLFPPDLSIEPIRYEAWQPPLYYLLAAPIYRLTGGALLTLRLLSVIMGGGVVLLTYFVVRTALSHTDTLALCAAAFVAFLPQHVAMMAGVNNDSLAELLMAAILLLLVRHVRGLGRRSEMLLLGLLLGLGLVTKGTAYIAAPLALLAILWRARDDGLSLRATATRLLPVFLPALILSLPWWIRNLILYGGSDFLARRWHDTVVFDQPRTAAWVQQFGLANVLRSGTETTFRSFWGQFGWMGVLMDNRIYLALALLSGVVGLGALVALVRRLRAGEWEDQQQAALAILATTFLLTGVIHIWYNLTFVQHQGRYLFPALIPIALAFAVGVREVPRPPTARWLSALLLVSLVLLGVRGWLAGTWDMWALTFLAAGALVLVTISFLPERLRSLLPLLCFLALAGLDIFALFTFIVPQLTP